MTHIPDGIVTLPVLLGGASVTIAGCALGLKRLTPEKIPQAALLSALFFVAALVHFPVGVSSVHLILSGLMGVMLGWVAFPVILVAAGLQALMFGFGGVAVLGVNVMNMAVPAVVCGALFDGLQTRVKPASLGLLAGGCGGLGGGLAALMVAVSLGLSGKEFWRAAQLIVGAHLPVMIIEAAVTAAAVGLLLKVKPGALLR